MANTTYVPYYRADRSKVVLRIIIDGKIAKVIDLGIKIEPGQWDAAEKKVVKHPNAKLLNTKINNKKAELEADITRAEYLGVYITPNRVKSIAEGNKITTDFYKYVETRIPEKYDNENTAEQARSEIRKLKRFSPSLCFGDITVQFLDRYHMYMKKDLGNKGNTPWKSLKFIRTFVNDADNVGGIVDFNPFGKKGGFKMPKYQETHKDGLYIEECDKIEALHNKDIPVMLKIAAAKFLFMCYSGLRISDAKRFDYSQHIQEEERLIITTQKTGEQLNLKLYGRLRGALEKLQSLPLKSFSDQYFNDWLKEVARVADITRIPLSSHVGRHTFGCILAEMDIPLDVAQLMMTHKKRETTKGYYKIRQKKKDAAADKLDTMN